MIVEIKIKDHGLLYRGSKQYQLLISCLVNFTSLNNNNAVSWINDLIDWNDQVVSVNHEKEFISAISTIDGISYIVRTRDRDKNLIQIGVGSLETKRKVLVDGILEKIFKKSRIYNNGTTSVIEDLVQMLDESNIDKILDTGNFSTRE